MKFCRQLALLAALPLSAQEWATRDTALEVACQVALLVDWKQTSEIHRVRLPNGASAIESNRILGQHPTQATINQYFMACSVGHLVVSASLPTNLRNYWQAATLSVSCYWIGHNRAIGISIRW